MIILAALAQAEASGSITVLFSRVFGERQVGKYMNT